MKEIIKQVKNLTFDEERALYALHNAEIIDCNFFGPKDGESALKECGNIYVKRCAFQLRYPFWHVTNAEIENCDMSESCRAALWYDKNITLTNCNMNGIKALRECNDINIKDCSIDSLEFGWKCGNIKIIDSNIISEYPFFMCKDIDIERLEMRGKYSFQYVENAEIRNSILDTKDAFWHSKNITVYDSIVKGEYLAWYSENLHLIRCKIIGTQPLCYAKGLVLDNCEMIDCDLSFEYSDVKANINGDILSVKNPMSGYIKADNIGEIIIDEYKNSESNCRIILSQATAM